MYNKDNIFKKIIDKKIPAKIIFENKYAMSFYDINPLAKIHALIIPKGEYEDILDFSSKATEEERNEFFEALKETITRLNLDKDGFRLISNCGINGSQEVPHLHFHILGGEKIGKMVSRP